MIDVVIPSYNRLDLLIETVKSVLLQSVKPNKIYIVDDRSSFSEGDFFSRLSDIDMFGINIDFIRNKKNSGACFSRNYGATISSSKYIAFLDDDDIWEPKHLENLFHVIDSNNYVLAYSGKKIRNFESGKERISYNKIPEESQFLSLLMSNYPGSTSSILVEREALLKVNGFDESLPAIQDFDFYLRLNTVGKFTSCSKPTLIYRNDTPLKITNQINKAVIAADIILKKYDGDDKKTLNKTLTKQNIKKCIRYFNFSCFGSIVSNYFKNR